MPPDRSPSIVGTARSACNCACSISHRREGDAIRPDGPYLQTGARMITPRHGFAADAIAGTSSPCRASTMPVAPARFRWSPSTKSTNLEGKVMITQFNRRSLLVGASALGSTIIVKPALAADYKFVQYHNQTAGGTLHRNLIAMWDAVRSETNGRVEATVHAENNKLPGGDPDALKLLL